MANKRISELTSITGANLADADLLVVVDVSDTTMAASGTNKKITMAELAKDSALTDNLVAKSTLTTNGDLLTRAAGEPARITRADLAADSAFTSRYQPQANDAIWVGAGLLEISLGTPSRISASSSGGGADTAWALDADAAFEAVGANVLLPTWWTTFRIDIWQTNRLATSGNVRWRLTGKFAGAGENPEGGSGGALVEDSYTIAAPSTANVLQINQLGGTFTNVSGKPLFFNVWRQGSNAADTLTTDIYLHGVMLTRLS